MEKREIDIACGQIRNGKKVVKNVKDLSEWITSLNFQIYHAQEKNILEPGVIKVLKNDLRYVENQLFQALNFYIEESNPLPRKNSKVKNRNDDE